MTTKTAHTPGPWTIDDNEMDIRVEAGCKLGVDTTVAIIPGDSREPEANAMLIAAAPELLGLLEQVTPYLDYSKEFSGELYKEIDRVLANAKGD